jgi:multiple sugar transport system substrate-binding protein
MSRGEFLLRGALAGGGLLAAPALLAACGGGDGGAQGELALRSGERVNIDFWQVYPGGSEIFRGINKGFRKENVGVDVTEIPGAYQGLAQKLQAAIAAGEPPAVVQVGYDALRYAAGVLPHLSADEAARRSRGGESWVSGSFARNILALGTVDGELHFLPYSISTPVLWYNEDALERAGVQEPPRTWEEVREDARRVSERTDLLGLTMTGYLWNMQAAVESNGARVLADTGDGLRCEIDSPEAVEATRALAEMALEDKSASFPALAQVQQTIGNFAGGKAAMLLESSAAFGIFRKGAKFPFGSATFPTWGEKPRRVPAGGNALGIFAKEEAQQAAAWEYIRFLLSPEALTAWDKETGYVPPLWEVAEDPRYLGGYYEENAAARAGLEQLEGVVPWASFPGQDGLQANKEIEDAFSRIFTGEQEVAPAYEQAAKKINGLIEG